MIVSAAGVGVPAAELVLRIGRITLHETAAYLVILAVLAVIGGLVSRHEVMRRQREDWRAVRRLLGRRR